MVCIRCKKRPAIIFIQRMENGQMKQEGYCLHCARELHIKPVEDLMKQFGMSEQDMDNMEDRMESMMEEMGEGANPLAALMNMQDGGDGSDGDEDGFTPGGNATFPLSITGQAGGQNGQQPLPVLPLEPEGENQQHAGEAVVAVQRQRPHAGRQQRQGGHRRAPPCLTGPLQAPDRPGGQENG